MSTILSANDLNDFLAPGVACIKPVEVEKTGENAAIEIGIDGVPVERRADGSADQLKQAQISLTDCLACSGCVTSSEAFLVELQSPKEVIKALEEGANGAKVFALSVAPQVRVSLAQAFGISVSQTDAKLEALFAHRLGFSYVVGTQIGRAIALEASAQEAIAAMNPNSSKRGPVLSSICPGWAVYAEKTHAHVLPYLSQVRSPQQITGRILKMLVARDTQRPPEDIFHLSIMPCFDKKLESARQEYTIGGAREVDMVITAREVVQLCQDLEVDFASLPVDRASGSGTSLAPRNWPVGQQWKSNLGSSSGGYLAYVLARAQSLLPNTRMERIEGKNSDYVDFVLVDKSSGETVFRGAQIYGFRNIQNIVRKLKPAKAGSAVGRRVGRVGAAGSDPLQYNYVEVMACPGGCINGGGQVGAPEGVSTKVWTEDLNRIYRSIELCEVDGTSVGMLLGGMDVSMDASLVTTEYKPLEKTSALPEALTVGTQW